MPAKKLNLHQKINEIMKRVSYIQKNKAAGMRYSIVSHDQVTSIVRPHFVELGVVYHPLSLEYRQVENLTQVLIIVRFSDIDNPEDYIDVPSLGYGADTQDKGPGKAVSYAVKYALLKTLGLETGDDPDYEQGGDLADNEMRAKVQTLLQANKLTGEKARKILGVDSIHKLTTDRALKIIAHYGKA